MRNKLDEDYRGLLAEILYNGAVKEDRTGTGTLSRFGHQIRHNMNDGFPLLTTKKIAVKSMMTELKWFLRGDTNIKYLVDNNCSIWNGDAYKRYYTYFDNLGEGIPYNIKEFIEQIKINDEFADEWGELGPIYGKQWRSWGTGETVTVGHNGSHTLLGEKVIDQIQDLISELKTNPDSRRLMVNAWNVSELDQMTLPPCHYGFQCYVSDLSPLEIIDQAKKDGLWKDTIPEGMTLGELQKDFKTKKLSLMWNQRSVDTFLGLPFNIASYGLLLSLIAYETGYKPGSLIGSLGDTHLYSNHIEQAKEQIKRTSFELPTLKIISSDILNGEFEVEFENYQSHPVIKAPLSN